MSNGREERIAVFQDTMDMTETDAELKASVKTSVAGTKFYPVGIPDVKAETDKKGHVFVTKERSFEAAMNCAAKNHGKRIVVHNFASATNPGGGVAWGSTAQEEALCRTSTLFPCLKQEMLWNSFYSFHRERHDTRYTNAAIYTPDVTVFKTDEAFPELMDRNDWLKVDVITLAAPNLKELRISDEELFSLHMDRAEKLVKVALDNKADCLITGAFGCGAFRNNPAVVASAFKEVMDKYGDAFDEVVFAIYCSEKDKANYEAFKRILRW